MIKKLLPCLVLVLLTLLLFVPQLGKYSYVFSQQLGNCTFVLSTTSTVGGTPISITLNNTLNGVQYFATIDSNKSNTVGGNGGTIILSINAPNNQGSYPVSITAILGQQGPGPIIQNNACTAAGSNTLTVTTTTSPVKTGQNPCPGGICETAIGSIPTNASGFASRVLAIAIGLAGGIALIIMVVGAIKILTSSNNQEKINSGRDMIVAAIAGLLFLIFSAVILRFIGVSLLGGIANF